MHIHAMGRRCFDLRPDDVWWSTSDIGWVVGHSYIVYAPLLAGCTTIAYEGALDHPDAQTVYRIVDENRVSGISPHQPHPGHGSHVADGDQRPDRRQPLWGERNPHQGRVIRDHAAGDRRSGDDARRPGAQGGREGHLRDPAAVPGADGVAAGRAGALRPRLLAAHPGETVYFSGDAAAIDEDGYVWFSGRADEIIKIAAHRIGTIEVETAFLRHPAVAEAGVTGRPDELRGEVISAFVALKQGHQPSEQLRTELLDTVRRELGPVTVIGELNFVSMLPKTRSGKIMRRVLKAVTLGAEPGDISTIEDEGSVEEARAAWERMQAELAHQRATST